MFSLFHFDTKYLRRASSLSMEMREAEVQSYPSRLPDGYIQSYSLQWITNHCYKTLLWGHHYTSWMASPQLNKLHEIISFAIYPRYSSVCAIILDIR